MLTPVVDDLASKMKGRLRVVKLNVDENHEAASRFRIQSMPALLLSKGGREVDRLIVQPKLEILKHRGQFTDCPGGPRPFLGGIDPAEEAAWGIPGITEVENRLEIAA
jgi:hypothetical protein